MNEANERDPFNNNSYGTLVDSGYKLVSLPVLDVLDFNDRIIRGYEEGWARRTCPPISPSPARSFPPAPRRCATSATSPPRSPNTSPTTAPAAWTA